MLPSQVELFTLRHAQYTNLKNKISPLSNMPIETI
jgi:hypothetical protein